MSDGAAARSTRLLGPVVLGLVALGGLAWLATGRTWARVDLATQGLPPDTVEATGRDAAPLAAALAIVVLTSALAVLATRGRVRRAIGVLVVLLGLGGAVVCLTAAGATTDALDRLVQDSPAYTGSLPDGVETTPWRLLAAVPLLLAALLGVVVVRLGHRWPGMGGRYEAPAARREVEDDPWKALDEGRDPTL